VKWRRIECCLPPPFLFSPPKQDAMLFAFLSSLFICHASFFFDAHIWPFFCLFGMAFVVLGSSSHRSIVFFYNKHSALMLTKFNNG